MELRHLLYFKTVAETLNFTRAAEQLHISQPPLSRQIKELEQELNVQLLDRNHKRVTLTDSGKYFKRKVDEILQTLEEAKATAKQIHNSISGELKIGYISSVYQSDMAEVLKSMHDVFPFSKASLYEVPTLHQIRDLEIGNLDVGILRAPVTSDQLSIKSLYFESFVLAIPAADPHLDEKQDLKLFLKNRPFIFFNKDYAPNYHQKLLEICQRIGFTPDITHEANNVHSILQLVEANLGVSILPKTLKKQYGNMRLTFIELDHIPVQTEVVLAYKKSNSNMLLKWFIDHFEKVISHK